MYPMPEIGALHVCEFRLPKFQGWGRAQINNIVLLYEADFPTVVGPIIDNLLRQQAWYRSRLIIASPVHTPPPGRFYMPFSAVTQEQRNRLGKKDTSSHFGALLRSDIGDQVKASRIAQSDFLVNTALINHSTRTQ